MEFATFVKMLRIKAILLVFVFLLGGNGLSIDIAQCCNSFTGVSLSFGQHQEHVAEGDDCCACLSIKNKKRACCEDVVIQTVINSVPATAKTAASAVKIKKAESQPVIVAVFEVPARIQAVSNIYSSYSEVPDQVPILIQKRVLQI